MSWEILSLIIIVPQYFVFEMKKKYKKENMTDEEKLLKQGKCPSCFGFKKRKYQGEAADYDCFQCNGTGKASEYLKNKRKNEINQLRRNHEHNNS